MKIILKILITSVLKVISFFSITLFEKTSVIFYKFYKKSWSIGYEQYKKYYIESVLKGSTTFLDGEYGATLDERAIEIPLSISYLNGLTIIMDAGSALNHSQYLKFLKVPNIYIVTLFPEKYKDPGPINYTYSDLRNLPFKSDYFDAIACISTIEHIGFDNSQYLNNYENTTELKKGGYVDAIIEMKRVLKQQGFLFITGPAGKSIKFDKFQVFDQIGIEKMIKGFATKNFELNYYLYVGKWVKCEYEQIKDFGYRDNNAAAATAIFTLKLFKQ